MAHRGIIPWTGTGPKGTTFQQGIAESDLKTKWTTALRDLSTYIPSNGEITSWVRHGFVSKADALPMYAKNAVTADVANLMMESALVDQLAEDRQLAKGEVTTMYQNQLIDHAEAVAALAAIGFHGTQATEILALADFRREAAAYSRVIQVIGRQVVMGKITLNNAQQTLGAMGVPSKTITVLVNDWKLAKQAEVPAVSAGTIVSAAYYGVETSAQAIADLMALGYTEYDAWRLLSVRRHGPVSAAPPETLRT
jgi:Holliday junction resolvasome RuvABC DNA-binding subunit